MVAPEPQNPHQHRFASPEATEPTPTKVWSPWSHRTHTNTGLLVLEPHNPHQHRFASLEATAPTPAQVWWPWSHRIHTSTGLLALCPQNPHHHKFVGPGATVPVATQVCWPCSRAGASEPVASTSLLALECPEPEHGALRPLKIYGLLRFSIKKSIQSQCSTPRPSKTICILRSPTNKNNTVNVFPLVDLPKPLAFMGVQTKNNAVIVFPSSTF